MKKVHLFYYLLITTMFVLASCMEKDLHDSNYNSKLGVKVPENFNWSTTKSLTVNVEVNDVYNGKYYYAVRVYDKAPGVNVLPIAASGEVNKYSPFSQKIVIPATVSKLYIAQVFKNADGSEELTTKELAITGEMITCSFGSAKSRSVSTRANDKGTIVGNNEIYEITSLNDAPNIITVENGGTLKFRESGELSKTTINIEDGGKMIADDNISLELKNSDIYNYGEVHIGDIEFDNGSVLYNGDAREGKNEGACFYANTIILRNGHGNDKRYLGERSYTSCQKLVLDNTKLTLKTSAWLKCDELDTEKYNGQGASTLEGDGNTIGETGYVGLAMIGQIIGSLTIADNILVECSRTTSGIIKGTIVPNASGLIYIVGTTCNEGGYGNIEKTELGKYTYIIEDMYPQEGDYDMNDIVVYLTATQTGNILEISGELRAVGAVSQITPYIKVGDEIKKLMGDETPEAHAALTGDNAWVTINTEIGSPYYSPKAFNLKFENVEKGLNMDNIDFYIATGNATEIHWNTHNATSCWGMRIPNPNFKWSQEKINITTAYPEFKKWFEDNSYSWYNNYESSKIYQ